MAGLDDLPADQAAALRLIAAGQTIDDVAGTLGVSPESVSKRLHDGAIALAGNAARRLTALEQAELIDSILGIAPPSPLLAGSPAAQDFARKIEQALGREPGAPPPDADPTNPGRSAASTATSVAVEPGTDSTRSGASTPASAPSRRGGAMLLAAGAAALLIAILFATGAFSSDGEEQASRSQGSTATTTTTPAASASAGATNQFVPRQNSQYPLRSAAGAKPQGLVSLGTVSGTPAVAVAATGMPAGTILGVWLLGPKGNALVGLQRTDGKGNFTAQGALPSNATQARNLAITSERYTPGGALPANPGRQLLSTAFNGG